MQARLKRTGIPLLAALLLTGLIAAAYAATSSVPDNPIDQSSPPQQTIGKNWRVGGALKPNGEPTPLKNLKDTADPAADRAAIESRSDGISEPQLDVSAGVK